MENEKIAIRLEKVTKCFGNFYANTDISFSVKEREIHAILGENGAGKSTLMNQLYGLIKPTSGNIYVNGEKVNFNSSLDAMKVGIGMVHQHFMLIDQFTVCENIVLGDEPMNGIMIDMKKARENVIALSKKYDLKVDPDAKVEDISVGMQQRVEILKALYRGAKILILDEPTASLTPQEIDELIDIMHNLTTQGSTIILITHKLKEIKRAADRCTIIRAGKYIQTVDVPTTSEEQLAEMMVGRKVSFSVEKGEAHIGKTVLEVNNLYANDYKNTPVVKGVNLNIHEGEIVGIAGIDGNGQMELVEILTGLKKATSGEIKINGIDALNKTPNYLFNNGISNIPADRHKRGLILDYSIEYNLIIQNYGSKPFSRGIFLNHNKINDFAKMAIKKYDIRSSLNAEKEYTKNLSGGNQQKVIIAREVENNKDLLICVNPTRGLDVGAIEFVHKYIVEQRNKGKAVLLVSFELDEIMSLSDRICVIFDGKINYEIAGSKASEKELGLMMAGGKENE